MSHEDQAERYVKTTEERSELIRPSVFNVRNTHTKRTREKGTHNSSWLSTLENANEKILEVYQH